MKYDVVIYGDPVLRTSAERIERIDDEIKQLASDMLDTMHESCGIGLAAQQIGKTIALCVIEIPADHDPSEECGPRMTPDVEMPLVMINPEITETSGEETLEEGCLSFPEIVVPIKRAEQVTVSFQKLDGIAQTLTARGLLARAIQHEIDHLQGVLIVDRMSPVKKISFSGRLKKLRKKTQAALSAVEG